VRSLPIPIIQNKMKISESLILFFVLILFIAIRRVYFDSDSELAKANYRYFIYACIGNATLFSSMFIALICLSKVSSTFDESKVLTYLGMVIIVSLSEWFFTPLVYNCFLKNFAKTKLEDSIKK
jgi:hypothetical protein